ncbi:MAG: hypothetical protein AMXMBFR4_25390 [Candidatus Hydrogenedentota bacterium]
MEQYIETIAHLQTTRRVASISDIADGASVSRPAASRAVRDLADKDLVEHQSYGYVVLTPRGEALARKLEARHDKLYRFFTSVLGFDEATADAEACRLEHQVDDEFAKRIAELASFFSKNEKAKAEWEQYVERLRHES